MRYSNFLVCYDNRNITPFAESTVRDCEPCGTTLIPYPLSTREACGDPMYLSFRCNISTSEVSFGGPDATSFRVININQSTKRFLIRSKNGDYCDSGKRRLYITSPFEVISLCSSDLEIFNSGVNSSSSRVIEIGWEPPSEPACTTLKDCRDWPHSTCILGKDEKKKCLCNTNFQWNSTNLNCTQGENAVPLVN